MAGNGAPRRGGRAAWLAEAVVAMALAGQAVWAQDNLATPTSRLRPKDRKAAALLRAGDARSATFRRLLEALEGSDLVLYIETRRLALPGQTQLVCATPSARYVLVSVQVQGLDNDLVPWLAHELWHAVEIAGAPDVRDAASLRRFYEKVGRLARVDGATQVETLRAQETRTTVLDELRRPPSDARDRQRP